MKNIEKKFCLFIGMFFLFIPIIIPTHELDFNFGFVSGLGFAGWMALPDKERGN